MKKINTKIKERDYRLDIIRILALFCVISVHFFLNSGFYEQTMAGKRMYIMMLIRTTSMICVPLFIILTGYLMNKKTLSKDYYKGITKTLIIYVLASICCLLYKMFYLNTPFTFFNIIKGFLSFQLADYSWYIEMYIGLFLLIPFLNLIYNNLKNKKEKQILILTLFTLTTVPTVLNSFNLSSEYGIHMFLNNTGGITKIFPSWWMYFYPITYYFIGAYLNEHKLNISKPKNIFLVLVFILIFGTYDFFCCHNGLFIWSINQDWGSLQSTLLSLLIFNLFLNIDFNKMPKFLKTLVKHLSNYSLGAYLVSCIFDNFFYTMLKENIIEIMDRLLYYPLMVPIVFISSLLLSFIINKLYDLIMPQKKSKV